MREPDYLSATRQANAELSLQQTAQWQGDWPPARKLAYNDRRIVRLSKQALQRLQDGR